MCPELPKRRRIEDGSPDPAYYAEIGGDATLRRVLDAFYDRAFLDRVLAPFFLNHDKATLKGKQFGFLRLRFTGERGGYMGQRPRNAHHWMVISDAVFDRRESLMKETLQDLGLSPAQVRKWIDVEEVFRGQIVKDQPWPLFYQGFATYWIEGSREEPAPIATVCDACASEIPLGATMVLAGDRVLCAACGTLGSGGG